MPLRSVHLADEVISDLLPFNLLRRGLPAMARAGLFFNMQEADNYIGNLYARVVDVILHVDQIGRAHV